MSTEQEIKAQVCVSCAGTGESDDDSICPQCEGSGHSSNQPVYVTRCCLPCHATGKLHDESFFDKTQLYVTKVCHHCQGRGHIKEVEYY